MGVFDHHEFDGHESVHYFCDRTSGLRAIIAIHSTALGPAAGGCRRWTYSSDRDALTDVLRLSRGMTYKNAIAGLPFGGGKSVILASDDAPKSDELFAAFGRAIDSLQGRYVTAEDVGIAVDDMRIVNTQTRFVSGLPQSGASAGGDPSPWTAYGVFLGIEASAKARLGRSSVDGLAVAVQGVGHVGSHLCRLLHEAGARLVVADVNREHLRDVESRFPVTVVSPRDIVYSDVDVLAPCALGNVLNSATIPQLRCQVVAGAANNQLATSDDGRRLAEHGILYAPDYVINAGGVISVTREYLGNHSADEVRAEIDRIPGRLIDIFEAAANSNRATNDVADAMARDIVARGSDDSPATARQQMEQAVDGR